MDAPFWPELPSGYQLIGSYGVLLAAPAEWNPVLLRGHAPGPLQRWLKPDPAPRGIIAFADLRATRLELRWRTVSSAEKSRQVFSKMVRKLQRAGLEAELREGAALIRAKKSGVSPVPWQVLAVHQARLYELTFPAGHTVENASVVDWFLRTHSPTSRQDPRGYLWSLYGCVGWAPLQSRVEKMVLQPGHVEISLAYRGGRMTLGSNGPADRLLAACESLLQWAKALHREGPCTGQWHVDGDRIIYTGIRMRKFCRRVHQELEFHHDAAANRILWQHRQRWSGGRT